MFKKLLGVGVLNAGSSAVNMLVTVLIVRWFGSDVYADYMVDLAYLSLILIFLELVPSNYVVFRVQEESVWRKAAAQQIFVSAVLVSMMLIVLSPLFNRFNAWIVLYACAVCIKRYMDIEFQSSGRLKDFVLIELLSGVLRLFLVAFSFYILDFSGYAAWASLALSSIFVLMIYFYSVEGLARNFVEGCVDQGALKVAWEERREYKKYYFGIFLKRLKDNFTPLAADVVLQNKGAQALFYISYRGIVFATGQIRLLEAMVNHRGSQEKVGALTTRKKIALGGGAQVLCLASSAALALLAGVDGNVFLCAIVLSFMAWPIVFFVIERSKAYSQYDAGRVNTAILGYLAVGGGGCFLIYLAGSLNMFAFSIVLCISEFAALFLIKRKRRVDC